MPDAILLVVIAAGIGQCLGVLIVVLSGGRRTYIETYDAILRDLYGSR